ncbi:MAG: DNA mismatch repair protein MutS [Planctomycetes bacterium]|nr:DNA mismatch repair protein MutS [Planctomycetota bacterium]
MSSIPLMEQYQKVKKRYPEEIVFFRLGDFYEMFYDDAKTASKILEITLTSRYKGDKSVPMAGIPYHSATPYIRKLLKAGYKIAVCEQLEEADNASGKLVERDVIRVITPGTLVEDSLLETQDNNFLAALNITKNKTGLSWVDVSTGVFKVAEGTLQEILTELNRLNPSEYLVPENSVSEFPKIIDRSKTSLSGSLTSFPGWAFDHDSAYKSLTNHFGTAGLGGFGCEDYTAGIGAAGAIIEYLHRTQAEPSSVESSLATSGLKHITRLEPFIRTNHLMIDRSTQSSLELVRTMRGEENNSLLAIMNKTTTGMGARLLKEWILRPLRNIEPINQRLSVVEWFLLSPQKRRIIQKELKNINDIERIVGRLGTGKANPRDMVGLKTTLLSLPAVKKQLAAETENPPLLRNIIEGLDPLPELTDFINKAIVDDPPLAITEGRIIKTGFDAELDKIRSTSREGKQWIARFQSDEIKRTGISSLKVGFNNIFGYYIEITNPHKDKIPADYIRKQTLKNAERYITPQLKDYETQVLHADERANKMEYELFKAIRDKVSKYITALQKVASAIAELDVLLSFAQIAQENNYCKPTLTDETGIKIIEGRHPVIEKVAQVKFIPNDTLLDNEKNRILLITGPNMAGKSTYIRQVALIALMAQMGSFVPAREAEIGIVDRIFTRVGASDELAKGASTFMVEMNETSHILNNATKQSLIILDEVGRGTSTFDGVSIAWAITEYIHDHLGSRTLFATHYHELTELALLLPAVKNYHVEVKEWKTKNGEEIVFLHKIAAGGTDKSYGIQVARLAGLPKSVVERARLILTNLEAQTLNEKDQPRFAPIDAKKITPTDPFQLALFQSKPSPVIKMIKELDLDNLTPLEALAKLQELKDKLKD